MSEALSDTILGAEYEGSRAESQEQEVAISFDQQPHS